MNVSVLPSLAPLIDNLQTLVICLNSQPKNISKLPGLGRRLLSQMPHLHTFLISDEPHFITHAKRFSYALDEPMQKSVLAKWLKYCPTLCRVSFTAAFMWEKKTEGRGWMKKRGPRGKPWPYYDD